jgi:biotin operon repressor
MEPEKTISIKYLSNLAKSFEELKEGIKCNEALWKNFNISPETIDEHINKIYSKGKEIEDLKKELSQKLSEARELKDSEKKILDMLEKRAKGIHADDENKLKDYGIGITQTKKLSNEKIISVEEKRENNFKAA